MHNLIHGHFEKTYDKKKGGGGVELGMEKSLYWTLRQAVICESKY